MSLNSLQIVLLSVCIVLVSACRQEINEVEFDLIKSYKLEDSASVHAKDVKAYWIVYDKEQFEIISDKHGYEKTIMSNILKNMDLDNYDYVVTENANIERLFYDPNFTDDLMYAKEKPLQVKFSDSKKPNQIFLYKLFAPKQKYRYVF